MTRVLLIIASVILLIVGWVPMEDLPRQFMIIFSIILIIFSVFKYGRKDEKK